MYLGTTDKKYNFESKNRACVRETQGGAQAMCIGDGEAGSESGLYGLNKRHDGPTN